MSNIGICKLCLKPNVKLCKSHIIPEFFYKPVYEKDVQRFCHYSTSPDNKIAYRQKGYYERLLCEDCEILLSKLENYTSKIIKSISLDFLSFSHGEKIVKDVDYTKFKLCILSILWRASVSRDGIFSNINLGPHENKIRNMLLKNDPKSKEEYGFLVAGLLNEKNKLFDGLICKPIVMKDPEGHRCYNFIYGGFRWMYIVSNHSKYFKYKKMFLGPDNILKIWVAKASNDKFIQVIGTEFRKTKE